MTKQMILREFQSYTKYRKGKEYQCNVCRKKINKCETYSRHYSQGMSEAITLHPECYEKQLKKEVGLKKSK